MSNRNLKFLAGALVVLVAVMLVLQSGKRRDSVADGELLFPGLKGGLNEVTSVTVSRNDGEVVLATDGETWTIAARDGYPASVDKIRTLLLAIADARIVERKTANPDLYDQLGVEDPAADGSKGTLVSMSGASLSLPPR